MRLTLFDIKTWAVAAWCVAAASSCQDNKVEPAEQTDEQLLYAMAMRELPDRDMLDQQVEQYRHELYVQTYLNLMLRHHAEAVTDEECQAFYDQYGRDMKLDEPIVKGLLVKLPSNTSGQGVKELKNWMKQLSQGNDECLPDLELYCNQRAALADNCLSRWVRFDHIADQLPVTVVEPRQFLAIKTYEMTDQGYDYYLVVTDYRLPGEVQPYEWARQGILELLVERKRDTFRHELIEQIRNKE